MVKNPPANAEDWELITGLRRSPGEGNGNPLKYSCLGDSMDRGDWKLQSMGFFPAPLVQEIVFSPLCILASSVIN